MTNFQEIQREKEYIKWHQKDEVSKIQTMENCSFK